LNGDDVNGVWTLQIADTARVDTGTLDSWSLNFTTGSDIAVTTAADGSYKFVDVAPGVHHIREVPQADFAETQPAGGFTISRSQSARASKARISATTKHRRHHRRTRYFRRAISTAITR
jgi:subtilisin-like proprotein convertase family protein